MSNLICLYSQYFLLAYQGECVAIDWRVRRPPEDIEIERLISIAFKRIDKGNGNVVEITVLRDAP